MKTKNLKSMPQTKLYNLEQYISSEGKERKTNTLAYNVPYHFCAGLKAKAETARHLPGTFFKIVPN